MLSERVWKSPFLAHLKQDDFLVSLPSSRAGKRNLFWFRRPHNLYQHKATSWQTHSLLLLFILILWWFDLYSFSCNWKLAFYLGSLRKSTCRSVLLFCLYEILSTLFSCYFWPNWKNPKSNDCTTWVAVESPIWTLCRGGGRGKKRGKLRSFGERITLCRAPD